MNRLLDSNEYAVIFRKLILSNIFYEHPTKSKDLQSSPENDVIFKSYSSLFIVIRKNIDPNVQI